MEKFRETTLPERKDFYSHLNKKDLTDAVYAHAERVCKNFEIKNIGEYHDIYMFKVEHYCWMMLLRTLKICVLMYMKLILKNSFQLQD